MEPAALVALNKSSLNYVGGQFSVCESAKFFIDEGKTSGVDIIRLNT